MSNDQGNQKKQVDLSKFKRTNKDNEAHMPYLQHIGELRKRVISILILFVVSMAFGFFIAEDVIHFLQNQPEAEPINMVVVDITDAFKVYFQFAIMTGMIVTFPLALYQIWAFISPGLKKKERKVTLSYIPGATVLFILGIFTAYELIFPFIIQFMTGFAERLNAQELYGMPQYFRFLFSFVVPFGIMFQMPLLVFFLTRLGIITPTALKNVRKYAYFGLFVLAAMITPPEVLSHLIVTLPLILLYELSITFSHMAFKKRQKALQESEVQQDEEV